MGLARSIYFKTGEAVMLMAAAVFALYIVRAFWSANDLLAYEERARRTTVELYRQEMHVLKEDNTIAGLSDLVTRTGALAGLKLVPFAKLGLPAQQSDVEVATDGRYFYLLRPADPGAGLPEPEWDADDHAPAGFAALAWPAHFGVTGEMCYYVDETGGLIGGLNSFGALDSLKPLASLDAIVEALLQSAQDDELIERGRSEWFPLGDLSRNEEPPADGG